MKCINATSLRRKSGQWGTQHLLSVWQKLWFARRTQIRTKQVLTQTLKAQRILNVTARLKSCPDNKT
jgi:hypothetical protein